MAGAVLQSQWFWPEAPELPTTESTHIEVLQVYFSQIHIQGTVHNYKISLVYSILKLQMSLKWWNLLTGYYLASFIITRTFAIMVNFLSNSSLQRSDVMLYIKIKITHPSSPSERNQCNFNSCLTFFINPFSNMGWKITIGAVSVQGDLTCATCRGQLGHVRGSETADITVSKRTTPLENGGKFCLWVNFTWQTIRAEKSSTIGLQATNPLAGGVDCQMPWKKRPGNQAMKAISCTTILPMGSVFLGVGTRLEVTVAYLLFLPQPFSSCGAISSPPFLHPASPLPQGRSLLPLHPVATAALRTLPGSQSSAASLQPSFTNRRDTQPAAVWKPCLAHHRSCAGSPQHTHSICRADADRMPQCSCSNAVLVYCFSLHLFFSLFFLFSILLQWGSYSFFISKQFSDIVFFHICILFSSEKFIKKNLPRLPLQLNRTPSSSFPLMWKEF